MRSMRIIGLFVTAFPLVTACASHAATFTGKVTNGTFNKPSAGDTVSLVDVQAGMADAATATTSADGSYTLAGPGIGPYLIRVSHQGAAYFIAAPQPGTAGNVTVYDVAARLNGVGIDADMFLIEAAGGVLRVHERYLVRNTSLPPRAQFSSNTFEIAIPPEAILDGAAATRPGGLGTNTHLSPLPERGHYTFNIPIQPDQGEKETLLEVQYHLSYSEKYTLSPHLFMPAENLVVYLAKGVEFSNAQGADFRPAQEDPRVQTYVAKNVHPGQTIRFTVSGGGQMTGDTPASAVIAGSGTASPPAEESADSAPDQSSRYKWWIVAGLTFPLIAFIAYLLRKRSGAVLTHLAAEKHVGYESPPPTQVAVSAAAKSAAAPPSAKDGSILLNTIKEELFAIESEKLVGTLSLAEYAEIKAGLEAILKRELKKRG